MCVCVHARARVFVYMYMYMCAGVGGKEVNANLAVYLPRQRPHPLVFLFSATIIHSITQQQREREMIHINEAQPSDTSRLTDI